jgi:arylsulfatase A-like enzyme
MPASTASRPNILFIMADDVGWFNIGAYHRGMMAGRTPNLDQLASEGMMFTDYYAEASCTAGRANFITGQLPIRTGLTTVGQAGAAIGMPAQAPTIATALKAQGYATGQLARTTSAIGTSTCPRCTVSTSSGATSITSTPWKTRFTPPIRRI